MADLIKTSLPESLSITYLSKGTGTTLRNKTEFLFLSDSPEAIKNTATIKDLADYGKWLNKARVTGTGQVYIWHHNTTGLTIKGGLIIYNPNTYAIKVNVPNYGTTLGAGGQTPSDSQAWKKYFEGQSTSITIPATSYGNLFIKTISNDRVYGVVAKTIITNSSTGASASADFIDLAYISNSGGANSFSDPGPAQRGVGNGFYQYINFAPIAFGTESTSKAYTIAASNDTFAGADCSMITDGSNNNAQALLKGAYGQIMNVKLPITNNTSSSRRFKIFIGSIGGNSFPFVYMGNDFAMYSYVERFKYVDVIETGEILANSTARVSFTTVIPAVSSTPYVIGVRPN